MGAIDLHVSHVPESWTGPTVQVENHLLPDTTEDPGSVPAEHWRYRLDSYGRRISRVVFGERTAATIVIWPAEDASFTDLAAQGRWVWWVQRQGAYLDGRGAADTLSEAMAAALEVEVP